MNRIEGFSIGNVEVKPGLIVAPMSGITNSAFRKLLKRENPGAIGLVVTEFISVEGLTRLNQQSLRMMKFDEEERPISIQIFGHDVDRMADAARMAQDVGADIVDINSGCPVPKVVKRGGGCELMRQPEHLEKILRTVKKAISIPLTLKIRSGWDETSLNSIQIARMAEESGVSMLAVHGRTRQQLYRGEADWEIIRQVASQVKIPVVGSGDVVNSERAAAGLQQGVAGIMIGRGALANPWVFSEILGGDSAATKVRSDLEVPEVLFRYLELLLEDMPERAAIGRMKQMISQVTRKVRGASPIRQRLSSMSTIALLREELSNWRDELANRKQLEIISQSEGPVQAARDDSPILSAALDRSQILERSYPEL